MEPISRSPLECGSPSPLRTLIGASGGVGTCRSPSLEDIHAWVAEHKLYKEDLARENIQQIMQVCKRRSDS